MAICVGVLWLLLLALLSYFIRSVHSEQTCTNSFGMPLDLCRLFLDRNLLPYSSHERYDAMGLWYYWCLGFDRAVRIIRILLSGLAKSDTVALPDDYVKMKVRYSIFGNSRPANTSLFIISSPSGVSGKAIHLPVISLLFG